MGLLARFLLALFLALSLAPCVRADEVAPHLVGLVKSLLADIDEGDYAGTGNPTLSRDMETALSQSRIRNWKGIAPSVAADIKTLAAPLHLDAGKAEHRARLSQLLAARDGDARDAALALIFAQAGLNTQKARRAAIEGYDKALAELLGQLSRLATIPLEDGRSLAIEWEPETSSLLARLDLGEGRGELVVHGAATGRIENGELIYKAEADVEPVTWISPSTQAAIREQVDGIWLDANGGRWLIRGGGSIDPGPAEAQAAARRKIAELKQELERLRAEKVYIWVDGRGGEVIQSKFRRLDAPFRYDRARSEAFKREEIEALQQRIDAASATLPPSLPVDAHGPLQRREAGGAAARPMQIEVRQADGWIFSYDEAAFDGRRVTASRTLRDVRDITELPGWVIATLIAAWSPPEWIELKARLNPRDRSVRLEGLRWRLVVHYSDGFSQSVDAIDTPWSANIILKREHPSVQLRVVDRDGEEIQTIAHDQPFRVEASFTEAPAAPPILTARREGGNLEIDLTPAGDAMDLREFASDTLYVRSADWAGRKEPGALFLSNRFVDEAELEASREEWRRLTQESERFVGDLFRGGWSVTHGTAAGAQNSTGTAAVNEDGAAASLILQGPDERLYRSTELRGWRGSGPATHSLEIRFEQVDSLAEAGKQATYPPLPLGQILYYPASTQEITFELDEATAAADLKLAPAPGRMLHLRLNSRDADHLYGMWSDELPNGGYAASGDANWNRARPRIRIGKLDFDYSGWHATRMGLEQAVADALAEVVAIGKLHQEQLQRIAVLQSEVQRLEAVANERRAALLAAIEAKDDVPDELKDVAYRRYESRVARGQARLDQIMERLPLASAHAKDRLVREHREVAALMTEDLRQMLEREERLGIARHRADAARRATEAEASHFQAVKDLARAISARNIVANVVSGILDDYHAAVDRHAAAQEAASFVGKEAPLITRVTAPHYQATIWHPEDDLRELERQIEETRASLHYWDSRRRNYRGLLPQRAEAVDRAAASLISWQYGSIAAQAGVELIFTGGDILVKLQSGGPYAALGEAYKKIVENTIWPPSYLDANNLVPQGHDLLDTLETNAPNAESAFEKRFYKSAGTGTATSALVATYVRNESASRLQELGQRMIHHTWLDAEEDFLRAVRRNFQVRPLFDAQRANLAKAEAKLADVTSLRGAAKGAAKGFVTGIVKDYAKQEAKQAIANLFEGEAFQAFSAAQLDYAATATLLLRCSNYYWQAADLLAGLNAAKREILSQYDPASAMKLSGEGEIDTAVDLMIEFTDRGRDSHHPNPIEMEVHLGDVQAERLSGGRLIFRVPAAALNSLPEGPQPLRVRLQG